MASMLLKNTCDEYFIAVPLPSVAGAVDLRVAEFEIADAYAEHRE